LLTLVGFVISAQIGCYINVWRL